MPNKKLFPQQYYKGRPGIARVKIHKPINPQLLQEKDVDNFNNFVYNIIFIELKNYESRRQANT